MLEETIPSFVHEPSKLATEQKIMMDRQKLEKVETRERSDSIVSTAYRFFTLWHLEYPVLGMIFAYIRPFSDIFSDFSVEEERP